ncbi:glycosyltransferase family A protein [Flavobacterium sp. j3]|uniref:Glycosyltransferase family A protein n=1 Tax=Flavobacterium aureirubrum TaxID=3133147 RepID=A0ABU9N2L8_9FLAO
MRIGSNPNKEINQQESFFIHQIIIPVYIPHEDDYFKDSFKILKLCLNSLFNTIHSKTFITIVNNGSCDTVLTYLDQLFAEKKINELIHTDNIGKINAVFKGLSGNNIQLVTIADADVLFLASWQSETMKIFREIPKAGVVGIVPQIRMYTYKGGNAIFDNFFSKRLKFIPVKNKEAMLHFYESIGWGKLNKDYLELGLGLEYKKVKCFIGSGHFVATYKKDIFEELITFIGGKKAAGIGEEYIDDKALQKDYWRLTTQDNYAYHMGNIYEEWMEMSSKSIVPSNVEQLKFAKREKISDTTYFFKNKLIKKMISIKWTKRLFLSWAGLPKEMIRNY